ncbi:MAG: PorT family protein [Prevotellaceae bacterium]|nr:PorT family protein [Prevotellaceae bacterium]
MKKLFLAAMLLSCAASAMAIENEPEEGFSWQAVLGMNISKIHGNFQFSNGYGDIGPFSADGRVGIDIGLRGEYVLPGAHGTYVSAGVEWSQKGAKQKIMMPYYNSDPENPVDRTFPGTYKVTSHYFYIPIHIGFRYNITEDWGVFAEVGPYFAIGTAGKTRFDADEEGTAPKLVEFKDKTFKKNDLNYRANGGLQRFDTGVGFRVGTEVMNHYSINLDCDWGLTDMLRGDYRDQYADKFEPNADKLRNFCISVTLGYRF